jgi:2-desacetyl-2-hydroxyethyl bacteriochlorophyllide A dehydrogenase
MRAIVLEQPGVLHAVDIDSAPEPGPDQANVIVRRIGLCGTDFRAFQGTQPFLQYPRMLGHELAVEVREVGKNNRGLAVGDRCAVEPYLDCGTCAVCRRGKSNCCVNLKVLGVHVDGGMAGQITLPVSKLHKSETLSLDQLAIVEPLAIGAHAVQRAAAEPLDSVLIIGMGPIGLSVAESVRRTVGEVIVMDIDEQRLDFCQYTLGFRHRINAKTDFFPQLRKILAGELPTVVFDCTGNHDSMQSAFKYVGHGGKLVFVGLFAGDITFDDPAFHARELTVLSSRNATSQDFLRVMQAMEAGQINSVSWVTHQVSSLEFLKLFPQWAAHQDPPLKAIIEW